jgi:mRNA-degrading endonuclease RelE of RelBE toxin-antitoxin system
MTSRARHAIRLAPEAERDLRALRAHVRARILHAIEVHLRVNPDVEGGKKKLIVLADGEEIWQLRVGDHRVFYDVDSSDRLVIVKDVRQKGRRTTEEIR